MAQKYTAVRWYDIRAYLLPAVHIRARRHPCELKHAVKDPICLAYSTRGFPRISTYYTVSNVRPSHAAVSSTEQTSVHTGRSRAHGIPVVPPPLVKFGGFFLLELEPTGHIFTLHAKPLHDIIRIFNFFFGSKHKMYLPIIIYIKYITGARNTSKAIFCRS